MTNEIDVDYALENNEFETIENWLKEKIHKHGALYKADAIIENVCGDAFDPNVYVDYLIDKYSKIYF